MLNDTTKRKINSLRDILVGKVPDPKSQVEQITNALIYKYMDDMDQQAVAFGGKASFFTGEYQKYSWKSLMDPKLGGQDRMNLYTESLEKMSLNKNLSPIFRDILKGAFLPYRSPETLNMFLHEIDGFSYDHSEDLGDAFEYLLAIMGSQGDAGQFRTPRHIIDFIVDVVDPKKNETILDPACGTAGFLISAYKHILENNQDKFGASIIHDEMRTMHKNFTGYDISPEMVKLSRVNMFLHNFPEPKIFEYDSLSSEERWDDNFDVILANPPFMTPKGGIIPHKRFSIPANRAEVLFVDYIMNHLRPKGRAGIIVPEGIIFQSGNVYKQLRKNLVEDGLYAVVSLPSGVFAPYSGVKTSILLFNNELAKKSKEICFVKIEQDGFDLGAQRRVGNKNDLPQALEILNKWSKGKKVENKIAVYVEKSMIAENGDYNLSGDRYRISVDHTNTKWPSLKLKELEDSGDITLGRGKVISRNDLEANPGIYPVYSSSAQGIGEFGQYGNFMFDEELITWSVDGGGRFFYRQKHKFSVTNVSGWLRIDNPQKINAKYLFRILDTEWQDKTFDYVAKAHPSVIREMYQIPLPPLEIQEQIVAELDGYQNIITGAKQIVQNWKPKIDIDPEWGKVKFGDSKVLQVIDGDRGANYPNKEAFKPEGFCLFLNTSNVRKGEFDFSKCDFINQEKDKALRKGKLIREDVVLTTRGTLGNTAYFSSNIPYDNIRINSGMVVLRSNSEKIYPNFLLLFLNSLEFEVQVSNFMSGSAQPQLPIRVLNEIEIPLPSLEIQKQIVEKIEAERALVESAKKLIEIYEQKIKDVVGRLWEE